MLPSVYKYVAVALLSFTSPLSTLSVDDYFSKLRAAVSDNDDSTVNQLLHPNSKEWQTENRGWEIACVAAEKGNLPVIEYIAKREPSIFERKNEQNETIGYIAAKYGHPKITEYFLNKTMWSDYSSSSDSDEIQSLFDLVAGKGYLNCMLDKIGIIHVKNWKRMARIAAQNGHLDVACYVAIKRNVTYCPDWEAIIITAMKTSRQIDIKTLELLGKLADEWGARKYCRNIVELASWAKNTQLLECLAERKCTYFLKSGRSDPCDPMKIAFEKNLTNPNFLDCLEKGNGTIQGYIGGSKLTIGHLAAERDRIDVIRFLVEKDASILERDDGSGETVVDIAADKGYADIVRYAIRHKPLITLRKTFEIGDFRYGKRWYSNRYGYHQYDRNEYYPTTAFHLCAAKNWMDMDTLKYVIEKEGTDLITRADCQDGKTVAHAAARNANMEILQYLVKKNPSVLSKLDSKGDTVLHILARRSEMKVADLKFFVDEGAPLLVYNRLNENIPIIAAKNGNLEILRLVVEKETSVFEGRAYSGVETAKIAASHGHSNILKFIVDKKPVLLADRPGILFKLPNASKVLDVLQYLKEACDTKITNWDCRHFESEILRLAFESDYPDIIRFMEYDVNTVNDRGEPLIFTAICRNRSKVFHFLAENVRTNLTALDREGNNILFIAAMNHDLEKLKYILEELKPPIDIKWRNHNGDSLLAAAAEAASNRLDSATYEEHQNAIRVWKYLVKQRQRGDNNARKRDKKTRVTSREKI